jgi:hypothetical protein
MIAKRDKVWVAWTWLLLAVISTYALLPTGSALSPSTGSAFSPTTTDVSLGPGKRDLAAEGLQARDERAKLPGFGGPPAIVLGLAALLLLGLLLPPPAVHWPTALLPARPRWRSGSVSARGPPTF